MRLLFLHQNFPGQFLHIAQALRHCPDVQMMAVTDEANQNSPLIPTIRYSFDPESAGRSNPFASHHAVRAARGAQVGAILVKLRERGFVPDLVIGHFGWGETLFVKDVFPQTKLLVHAEYYYSAAGGDANFDPEFSAKPGAVPDFRITAKNAALLSALVDADFGVAPTHWQGSRFPAELRKKIVILHEGIDTQRVKPGPDAVFAPKAGKLRLTQDDEVITFVNRNLEPHRGYHIFMRALPKILAARPRAQAVIVGGDGISYGADAPAGKSWKQIFLDEVANQLPMDRVHFTGKIPHADFVALMQISKAHVYLTYPFVLSWSMLEAMSAGVIVIGSKTPPVEEVIADGKNGLLVDFFDKEALADRVIAVLADPELYDAMKIAARETIEKTYDLKQVCLPKWLAFIDLMTRSKAITPSLEPTSKHL
jgi:glycosyltransferase involved in cell wall biosynthesis